MKTYNEILELVENDKITNAICKETGKPIFHGAGRYMLAGELYCEESDIDSIIERVSKGQYSSREEAYDDEGDYFYWTTHDDAEDIAHCILEDEYYYDENGILKKL